MVPAPRDFRRAAARGAYRADSIEYFPLNPHQQRPRIMPHRIARRRTKIRQHFLYLSTP
jgi:hypothetical protein